MSKGRLLFVREFPSTLPAMAATLDAACTVLAEHGWVKGDKDFCFRLCLEEAFVNALKHGNEGDPARMVRVAIAEQDDACHMSIHDEGGNFDPDKICMPPPDQAGGRGICLIRHYMDDVTYDHETHCLEMTMRREPCCKGG